MQSTHINHADATGWDQAFSEGWETRQGPAQTAFFAEVALAALPRPFIELVCQHQLEVLDWGCALGDALPVLAKAFVGCPLTGLDISTVAIEKARQRHPQFAFTTHPLLELGRQVPVVFSSNCLEHFEDPLSLLREQILPAVRDYLVILVPFLELRLSPGHFVTFDQSSFPPVLDDFGLLCYAVIPTADLPNTHWKGQQLLLIYARRQAVGIMDLLPRLMQT